MSRPASALSSVTRDRRRAVALSLAGLFPWAAVVWAEGFYLVFSFGWTHRALSGFTVLPSILLAPRISTAFVEAWGFASALYVLALGSAALDRWWRGDRRVTAGLLFLAGVNVLWFTLSLSGQRGITVLPLGLCTLWPAAAYEYWTLATDDG